MKYYRFICNRGVPISNRPGNFIWRRSTKTVSAYCMQDAVQRLTSPFIKEFGSNAKLHLEQGFVSEDKKQWRELNIAEPMFAAFILGMKNKPLTP